jgi:hypothetical protein
MLKLFCVNGRLSWSNPLESPGFKNQYHTQRFQKVESSCNMTVQYLKSLAITLFQLPSTFVVNSTKKKPGKNKYFSRQFGFELENLAMFRLPALLLDDSSSRCRDGEKDGVFPPGTSNVIGLLPSSLPFVVTVFRLLEEK